MTTNIHMIKIWYITTLKKLIKYLTYENIKVHINWHFCRNWVIIFNKLRFVFYLYLIYLCYSKIVPASRYVNINVKYLHLTLFNNIVFDLIFCMTEDVSENNMYFLLLSSISNGIKVSGESINNICYTDDSNA